jgi:hypothetical protein
LTFGALIPVSERRSHLSSYTTVEEQIRFGVAKVDPSRTIELPLRDLLQAYLTIGELIRFFHQPMHYQTLEDVQRFLGTREQGAYSVLHELYYDVVRDVWPDDIDRALEEGELEHPDPPYYLQAARPGNA